MLLTLDRYLLRQFVGVFAICFVSLMGLYVVIDAFSHLDKFSRHADQHGNLLVVIADYYSYKAIDFFDRTSGVLSMIAAVFTVTWLQRHHELTAIMAAGIPKTRIVRPIILAVIAISLAAAANRETLIPSFKEQLGRTTKDLAGVANGEVRSRFDRVTGLLITGEQVIASERKLVRPTFILPKGLRMNGKQLAGESAVAMPAANGRQAGYLVDGVTAPLGIDQLPTITLDGQPLVITPREAAWLEPGQAFVASGVPFQLLVGRASWTSYASTGELLSALSRPSTKLGPSIQVAIHARVLQPLMDTTLLMLGLPLMFSRRSRNVFLSIGLCVCVAAAFSVAILACRSLGGVHMLSPALAAWLPLLVFGPVAVGMSQTLQT